MSTKKKTLVEYNGKYPFAKMNIGDSAFIPFNGEDKETMINRVSVAMANFWKFHPSFRFTMETKEKGIRVWRIKVK